MSVSPADILFRILARQSNMEVQTKIVNLQTPIDGGELLSADMSEASRSRDGERSQETTRSSMDIDFDDDELIRCSLEHLDEGESAEGTWLLVPLRDTNKVDLNTRTRQSSWPSLFRIPPLLRFQNTEELTSLPDVQCNTGYSQSDTQNQGLALIWASGLQATSDGLCEPCFASHVGAAYGFS